MTTWTTKAGGRLPLVIIMAALWLGGCAQEPAPILAPPGPAASAPASPQADIGDFFGSYVGATVPGADTLRRGTVLIERGERGGFAVTWTSFEALEEVPVTAVVTRERTLAFEPSTRPGIWRSVPNGNAVDIPAGWAWIKGRVLMLDILVVTSDGELERQSYERRLTPEGLMLTYRRFADDKLKRTLDARYIKQ